MKAVYGDTESNKQWYDLLTCILRDYGFQPADTSGCILILHKSAGLLILAIIIDDILIGFACKRMYEHYLEYVETRHDLAG